MKTIQAASRRLSNQGIIMLIVAVVMLAGAAVRLYDLTDPPLDFHPTRQLRSAIIARGIYYTGLPDSPRRDMALKTMNSLEAYEPPVFETLVAGVYRLSGGEKLWVSRIFSTFFWLVAAAAFLLLLRRWKIHYGGIVAAGFFMCLPFAVQASRSFQPDPFMVMWISIFSLCVDVWKEKKNWKWALITGLVSGITVLTKAVAAFFVGGILLLLVVMDGRLIDVIKNRKVWLIALLCVLPPALYYLVGMGSRAAGFFSNWTLSFLPLLTGREFYSDWVHMIDSLVGLPAFFTALTGTILLPAASRRTVAGLWLGYLLYGLTSPYQFITHTYYHLPLVLITAVGLAPVAELVYEKIAKSGIAWRIAALAVLVAAAGYSLWVARSILYSEDYRSEVKVWAQIGAAVPDDGPVIALTQDYGNRLMYYGWTKVSSYWPTTSAFTRSAAAGNKLRDLQDRFNKSIEGKKYFLVTAMGQLESQPVLKEFLSAYPVVSSGDGYILYGLTGQ